MEIDLYTSFEYDTEYNGLSISCSWELTWLGFSNIKDYKSYDPNKIGVVFVRFRRIPEGEWPTVLECVHHFYPNINYKNTIIVYLDVNDPVDGYKKEHSGLLNENVNIWCADYKNELCYYLGPLWIKHSHREIDVNEWSEAVEPYPVDQKTKYFLSLCNMEKWYRSAFYKHIDKDLLDNSYWSYVQQGKMLPYFDRPTVQKNIVMRLEQRKHDKKWWQDTFFSVLHETAPDILFISEKTVKCIRNEHPFIYCGKQNYVDYLQFLGFRTKYFVKIPSLSKKPERMVRQITKYISKFIQDKKHITYFYCKEAIEERNYNKKLLLNKDFWDNKISFYAFKALKQTYENHIAKTNR